MPHFIHHFEENYLKAVFKLSQKEIKKVNNVALAKTLNLNPATVLEMVRKLTEKKLLQLLPDKSIQLTEKGKVKALQIIRKHRLWEVFLVQTLNFKWDEVHVIAEQLEHIQSEELIERLDKFLEHPKMDPHGDPIPDTNGKISSAHLTALSELKEKETGVISGVAEHAVSFLQYLEKSGLNLGNSVQVLDKHEFDKSVDIKSLLAAL